MGPAVDLEGNLYYSTSKGGLMCIGVSYMRNGKYTDEMVLPPPIYSEKDWTMPQSMVSQIPIKGSPLLRVSPDGKYLFYTQNGDIYWVSTKIIKDLQPDN